MTHICVTRPQWVNIAKKVMVNKYKSITILRFKRLTPSGIKVWFAFLLFAWNCEWKSLYITNQINNFLVSVQTVSRNHSRKIHVTKSVFIVSVCSIYQYSNLIFLLECTTTLSWRYHTLVAIWKIHPKVLLTHWLWYGFKNTVLSLVLLVGISTLSYDI